MTEERPVGPKVDVYDAGAPPDEISGHSVRLERISEKHTDDLFEAVGGLDGNAPLWDYMGEGPYESKEEFAQAIRAKATSEDPHFYAVVLTATGRAVGCVSFLKIDRPNRTVEVGHVLFSKQLQRTRAATEIFHLMARTAFDQLRVRRYQWRCNSLNAPSRRAALRLGFTFEGITRQEQIVKGRNRDTAWFSILDSEWPAVRRSYEQWLRDDNFDGDGRQIKSLAELRT